MSNLLDAALSKKDCFHDNEADKRHTAGCEREADGYYAMIIIGALLARITVFGLTTANQTLALLHGKLLETGVKL